METQLERASKHLTDILREAIQLTPPHEALVIFDTQTPLASLLTEAYRRAIPNGTFVDFDGVTPDDVRSRFDHLNPGDLVVLVQSTNFRLNDFRLRIELFKRDLKTIEHTHLARMTEVQYDTYIDALTYDAGYYKKLGHALKSRLDTATEIVVECNGTTLVYEGPMEDAKLNIGDYSGMKNVGGTFPIGEVFTEATEIKKVNGEALVFAFAGMDHIVRTYEPFLVRIKNGMLEAPDCPAEFAATLDMIREDEDGVVLVREFGLGINPAMDKHRLVNDITAFERQTGLHLSLGAKHAMYAKPGLKRKGGRYHVDIFIDAQRISINRETIYEQGTFLGSR